MFFNTMYRIGIYGADNFFLLLFMSHWQEAQTYPERFIGTWDATYYRPACPQIEDLIQQDIPGFEYTNEDCLHINVFQPNVSINISTIVGYMCM